VRCVRAHLERRRLHKHGDHPGRCLCPALCKISTCPLRLLRFLLFPPPRWQALLLLCLLLVLVQKYVPLGRPTEEANVTTEPASRFAVSMLSAACSRSCVSCW
jgi:hypothetical protein